MMPQMEADGPKREQPGVAYRGYDGNQGYAQPQQETPYSPPQAAPYDDNFVEAVAQRILQRTGQGQSGKIYAPERNKETMGLRLGLAIVSVVMLIPLAGILVGAVGGLGGMVAFGVACFAILAINAVFNNAANK